MHILYLANVRLPTEKAHGLQIVQNCEALAETGAAVSLWAARRVQTPALRGADPFAHYGVRPAFRVRRVPTLDLLPWAGEGTRWAAAAFAVQLASYLLVLAVLLPWVRAGTRIYTRDERIAALVHLLRPRLRIGYEPHQLARGRAGRWFQRRAVQAAHAVFPVTAGLAEDLAAYADTHAAVRSMRVLHDGIRAERFADVPAMADARARLGWPADAFIVGYVGRLSTMAQDKGVGLLIEAAKRAGPHLPVALAIVGGPAEQAEALRRAWVAAGLAPERCLLAGQVSPEAVPAYMAAFSVCAMPLPDTPHFARHASPLKLFEYMASGRPVLASGLPGFREAADDGVHTVFLPPDSAAAWADAFARLAADPAECARLAEAARAHVFAHYTWAVRARHIAAALEADR